MSLKPLDIAVFIFALAVIGGTSYVIYGRGTGTAVADIEGVDQEWILPLDKPATLNVAGPLGDTLIQVADGSIRVVDSPCAEKICIKTGRVSRSGQWIACLPNRVFIRIRAKKAEADAYSY